MNAALRDAMGDPRLASLVSLLPIVAFLAVLWLCLPMPWCGLVGVGAADGFVQQAPVHSKTRLGPFGTAS